MTRLTKPVTRESAAIERGLPLLELGWVAIKAYARAFWQGIGGFLLLVFFTWLAFIFGGWR